MGRKERQVLRRERVGPEAGACSPTVSVFFGTRLTNGRLDCSTTVQYEFQHSELVSKKEKFNRMSEKIEDSVSARQSTLSYQQEQVLRLRGATPSDPNSVVTDLFRNEERSRRFAANADEFVVERADVLLAHSVGCIEQWVQQVGMLEDVDRRKSSRLAAHLGISSLDLPPPSQACGGSSQAHEVDVNGQEEA